MSTLNDLIAFTLGRYSEIHKQLWLEHSPVRYNRDRQNDIKILNQFLRLQLGLLSIDTTRARECLVNDTDESDWFEGFEQRILPIVLEHGLPAWRSRRETYYE